MIFEKVAPSAWQATREPYDYHVRVEGDAYVVDVFQSAISDADMAYVTSEHCESWDDVEEYCANEPEPLKYNG